MLKNTFLTLRNSHFEGASGVLHVDSGKPGPVLGITVCTHGDEPSGLALAGFLMQDDWLQKNLQCGQVFIVLNNAKAAERYFAAQDTTEQRKARLIDLNYNRLPENAATCEDPRYEVQRLKELYPVYCRFEVGMDVHSTTLESEPMIIRASTFDSDLIRGFPIDILLSHIDEHQIGVPGFAFYGGQGSGIPTFEIECGSHENPASFQRAIDCGVQLLKNLGMLAGERSTEDKCFRHYDIVDSIYFPNDSYELVRIFPMFEPVKKGELLATGNGDPILAPCDGHLLMGPNSTKPRSIAEEVFFVSAPMEELKS